MIRAVIHHRTRAYVQRFGLAATPRIYKSVIMNKPIDIEWNTLSLPEWEERFARISHSNLLQSYSYAKAQSAFARQRPKWGLIKIDGQEAGLVQLFEAGVLFNLFHAVILDRGPLWFDGYGNAMHAKRFFEAFGRQFPIRFGRKRRILPEIEDGPSIQKMMTQQGFEKWGVDSYQTYWLDLQKPEEELRANLKTNWRGKLGKSEKTGLVVDWDFEGKHASWMRGIYAADKSARGYGGPAPAFLIRYIPELVKNGNFCLGRATLNGDIVAFTLFVKHGRSATYFLGWSGDLGRESAAHHLLLWEGIKMLKQQGIKELDLGGVNDESAQGVKSFKEAMGGRYVCYAGVYR